MRGLLTSTRKKEKTLKLNCIDGPFAGHRIELSDTVPCCSAYFKVASHGNKLGRYVKDSEHSTSARWEPK